MYTLTMTILVVLVSSTQCYGPHHPKGPHRHYKPMQPPEAAIKLTHDNELIHDEVHIQEDLSYWNTNHDTSKMTPQELAFYYFKVHDFDNNTKLDGLEILQAIRHTVHENADGSNPRDISLSKKEFEYYSELIDRVFAEDDLDNDGYLSYMEYALGREKDEKEKQKI